MNSSTTNPNRPKLLNIMVDEDGRVSMETDDQVLNWFKGIERNNLEEIISCITDSSNYDNLGLEVFDLQEALKEMDEKVFLDVECLGEESYDDNGWLESNVNDWEGIKLGLEQELEGRTYKMYSWGLEYDINLLVVFED